MEDYNVASFVTNDENDIKSCSMSDVESSQDKEAHEAFFRASLPENVPVNKIFNGVKDGLKGVSGENIVSALKMKKPSKPSKPSGAKMDDVVKITNNIMKPLALPEIPHININRDSPFIQTIISLIHTMAAIFALYLSFLCNKGLNIGAFLAASVCPYIYILYVFAVFPNLCGLK